MNFDLTLYLVTNRYQYSEEEFLNIIDNAITSGVTLVQLREKNMTRNELYHHALKVKEITDKHNVPLLINDHVDIALAVDADGVHLGDNELPISVARKLLGPDKIIGVSVKTTKRLKEAEDEGADYIGTGAFFKTATKDTNVLGKDAISHLVLSSKLPAVGIGGLTLENMDILKDTGVKGAALVSEIMKAEDVSQTVRRLKEKILNILGEDK